MGDILVIIDEAHADDVMACAVRQAVERSGRLFVVACRSHQHALLAGCTASPELYSVWRERHEARFAYARRALSTVPVGVPVTSRCCEGSPRAVLRELLGRSTPDVAVLGDRRRGRWLQRRGVTTVVA